REPENGTKAIHKRWTVLRDRWRACVHVDGVFFYGTRSPQDSSVALGGRTWKEVRRIPSAAAFGVACSCSSSFPCVDDSGAFAPTAHVDRLDAPALVGSRQQSYAGVVLTTGVRITTAKSFYWGVWPPEEGKIIFEVLQFSPSKKLSEDCVKLASLLPPLSHALMSQEAMAPNDDCASSTLLCVEDASCILGFDNEDDGDDREEQGVNRLYERKRCDLYGDLRMGFPSQVDERLASLVRRETEHMPRDDYAERLRSGALDLSIRRDAIGWILKFLAFRPSEIAAAITLLVLPRTQDVGIEKAVSCCRMEGKEGPSSSPLMAVACCMCGDRGISDELFRVKFHRDVSATHLKTLSETVKKRRTTARRSPPAVIGKSQSDLPSLGSSRPKQAFRSKVRKFKLLEEVCS
ncbi:hypothetical protein BHE74_00025374, partial [Ensete ventricosum]